jgi:hypothetical protein
MDSSTANQITTKPNQNFFLSPQFPSQRMPGAVGLIVGGKLIKRFNDHNIKRQFLGHEL